MARKIEAKINLTKIDKSRIFTSDKGNKFLEIVIIETPGGQYGDWLIVEKVSKSDYDKGVKGNILGNGKNWGNEGSSSGQQAPPYNGGGGSSGSRFEEMPF